MNSSFRLHPSSLKEKGDVVEINWEQIEEEWDGVERRITDRRATERRGRQRHKFRSENLDEEFVDRRGSDRRAGEDRRRGDRRRVPHDYDQGEA